MDNLIHQQSKRRGTSHPRGVLIKGATSKPLNVQVIKHFEPSITTRETTELPYLVTEDDDDRKFITLNISLHPSRHITRSNAIGPSKNKNKITKAKTRVSKIEYSVLPNNDYCNKQNHKVLNKSKAKKSLEHNKRSSSVTLSQSNGETKSKYPFKKPRPSQPTSKSSVKIDNVCNFRNGVNQLNSKLDQLEHKIATIKEQCDKNSADRFVDQDVSEVKKCTLDKGTNSQMPYSFVTASYIKSLKNEIESARLSSKELHKSAESLRAEIKRFRNSAEYVNSKVDRWKSYTDTGGNTFQKEKVSNVVDLVNKHTQKPITQDVKLQVLGFNSVVKDRDKKSEYRCSGTQYENVISSPSSSTTENQITVLVNTKIDEFQKAEENKELLTLFENDTPSKNDKSEDNGFTLTVSMNTDNENESRQERHVKYDEIENDAKVYSPSLSEKLSELSTQIKKDEENENVNADALIKPNTMPYLEKVRQNNGKVRTVGK